MWILDFRTRDVGGPVAPTPAVYDGGQWRGHGAAALPIQAAGATFVVHGYNKDRKDGRAQVLGFEDVIRRRVPELAGTQFVGVLWPGDAIFGFLSYPTEEDDADRTARALADFLRRWAAPRVSSFVAHSLGSRVVLATLDELARSSPDRAWGDQVVLMAAAVDGDCLADRRRYQRGANGVTRLVNVASTADKVLKFGFPVGDWMAGVFSKSSTKTALGRHGPAPYPRPPATVRAYQVGRFDIGHGDYLGNEGSLQRRSGTFAGRAVAVVDPLEY